MLAKIEGAPDQTLILIEEIENGLHPVATVHLVEYLIDVAERKKVQVIFTTHSNEAIQLLPTKAVWVATQDRIFQGMNKYHNANPAIQTPSICIIDGDSSQNVSDPDWIYRLPGGAPESHVFDTVIEAWPQIGGKLSVAVHAQFEDSDKVLACCKSVRRQNMDAHLLFAQVGEQLGLVPESTVNAAFANIWAQVYPDPVQGLIEAVRTIIPELATSQLRD